MIPRRSPRTALGAGRLFLLWLAAALSTLVATHIPIHIRLSMREKDLAFFIWVASVLACIPMLLATWLSDRVKLERFTDFSVSFLRANHELYITSFLRAGQLCMAVHFLASEETSAAGFPVANAVSFGLIPVFVNWLVSLGKRSPFLHSSTLHQVTMALLACGLLYAATGLMRRGFFFRDAALAVVAALLAASSKVSLSVAYEHNSAFNIVLYRLLAVVGVFPVYISIFGQAGAVFYWLSHCRSVGIHLLVLALALPLADYVLLHLQIATLTPFTSVVTDAVAWLPSSLLGTFLTKADLYNSSFAGFLVLPFAVSLNLLSILFYPYVHSVGIG